MLADGTTAVRLVALTNVVASWVAPHITFEPLTKPVPVTVRLTWVLAAAVDGLSNPIAGPPTVKAIAEGVGARLPFWTVTLTAPVVKSSAVVTCAVIWVALPGVVASGVVPHITVEGLVLAPLTKFVPVTVRVKPADPAAIDVELSPVIVGPLTLKVLAAENAAEDPLPFWTVTLTGPADANCAAVTAAVIFVALT